MSNQNIQENLAAVQLSGIDERNNNILSVLVKRCYQITNAGKCEQSDEPAVLSRDFEFKKENEEILLADTDIYCNKPYTDLVIKGNAYNKQSSSQFRVLVDVSNQKNGLALNISGKRLAYKNQQGKIIFTEPAPLEKIPLEYEYAYGGVDWVAEEKFEYPDKEMLAAIPDFDWKISSPYRYPRNPVGKGFLVEDHPRSFENLELPNIEDVVMPLTPSNLVIGKPENWIYQPLSRATCWVNPSWYPRIAYFGFAPEYDPEIQLKQLPEFIQKLVEPDILADLSLIDKINRRASNGASLGLQFPYLNGNESVRLVNIHPVKDDFVLQLPAHRPKIWVDGRNGKLLPTTPVLQTVVIEPDKNRLYVVWRGTGPAIRPYMDEELKTMPFKVEWQDR